MTGTACSFEAVDHEHQVLAKLIEPLVLGAPQLAEERSYATSRAGMPGGCLRLRQSTTCDAPAESVSALERDQRPQIRASRCFAAGSADAAAG
jgi:hypothetical protein